MMSFLFSLVWGSWLGRCLAVAVIGLAALKAYGLQQQHVGKEKVIEKSQIEGQKLNEKAKKARDRSNVPTAATELLRQYPRLDK